jgi:hypothetical protein
MDSDQDCFICSYHVTSRFPYFISYIYVYTKNISSKMSYTYIARLYIVLWDCCSLIIIIKMKHFGGAKDDRRCVQEESAVISNCS